MSNRMDARSIFEIMVTISFFQSPGKDESYFIGIDPA